VGIRVTIEEVDWAVFESRRRAGEFDAEYQSIGLDPSPAALATDWTEDGFDEFNVGKYSNPEYTRLVREARADMDPVTSLPKWHAALRIINADAPAIWLYVPKKFAAVHARFEGVTIFPYQPFRGLREFTIPPTNLIERDLYGAN
jgi:ABC-type transport system substrate-binding protein